MLLEYGIDMKKKLIKKKKSNHGWNFNFGHTVDSNPDLNNMKH